VNSAVDTETTGPGDGLIVSRYPCHIGTSGPDPIRIVTRTLRPGSAGPQRGLPALNVENRLSELSRTIRQFPALLRPLICNAKSRPDSQEASKPYEEISSRGWSKSPSESQSTKWR